MGIYRVDNEIYGILFSVYNDETLQTTVLYEKKYKTPMPDEDFEDARIVYNTLTKTNNIKVNVYIYGKSITSYSSDDNTFFMWWPVDEKKIISE
jgi:hypothetical protein